MNFEHSPPDRDRARGPGEATEHCPLTARMCDVACPCPAFLNATQTQIGERILKEINERLGFLVDVGLEYLTLNRSSGTLSGGESQRINLATSLGSSLVGSMYILDEPSIGLHPKDTERLINVLKALRDLGNTVIVVEQLHQVMRLSRVMALRI